MEVDTWKGKQELYPVTKTRMPFILYPIVVLGIMLTHCAHLFLISRRHRKHILENGSDPVDLRHNQEHLAGVVLMFFCGTLLEIGMVLIFIDLFVIGIAATQNLLSYMWGMMGTYLIANIWYVTHLKREESGFFGSHSVNHLPKKPKCPNTNTDPCSCSNSVV